MIGRCTQQRELNFRVAERMTEVTAGLEMLMICLGAALIVDASRILTRKVW